jgi:hypothetical protein
MVSKNPTAYRVTVVFRNKSAHKLGGFGFYFRVVTPIQNVRLGLNSSSYSPEQTVFGRIENFGTETVRYGAPYVIERLEGTTWVTAPETPRVFIMPLYGASPGKSGSPCSSFWIPPAMASGRYRMSKEINRAIKLMAEFDIAR